MPDVTNKQVQINTVLPGLAPPEIERQITFPLEVALAGMLELVETRSISQFGLSQVTVIFEDNVDIYFAAYIPILTLQGIEGKMFRPRGMTVIMALLGAMLLSITLTPALCAFFLKIIQGNTRFGLALRLSESHRRDPQAIGRITVPASNGAAIPLSQLASIISSEGPVQISRENGWEVP